MGQVTNNIYVYKQSQTTVRYIETPNGVLASVQQVAQSEDGQMQMAYGKRIIAVADSSSGTNVTHCVVQETVAVVANPIYITAVPQLSYDSDVSDDSDVSESWHFIFFYYIQ